MPRREPAAALIGGPLEVPESRRAVWLALSELFLDTGLQAADLRFIARVLAASGDSLDELEDILWAEVAPVVGWNLFSPVGVWSGFDPAWLEESVRRRLRHNVRQARLFRLLEVRLARLLWERSIRPEWEGVKALLTQQSAPA